jgi:drug/metabolite transporter (DMT)-like permease
VEDVKALILDSSNGRGQIRRSCERYVFIMKNLPSKKSLLLGTVVALVLLAFIYTYPRLIISWLGESNPWTSYLYLYGFGAGFFLMGIFIILRTGACRLDRGHDKLWFWVLLGGFFFFATVHGLWILASLNIPYLGA